MSQCMLLSVVFLTVLSTSDAAISSDQDSSDQQNTNSYSKVIQTTLGLVQGRTETVRVKNGLEVMVDVFWGLPYAKPPVGDLRFRRPVPSDPWRGVFNATTPPNSCMQMLSSNSALLSNPTTPLSEDCLYLNIWRPNCGTNDDRNNRSVGDTKLSTMVWIHGGMLVSGSTTVSLYNGAQLAASECVIVASMNYRLGALGFMYLGVPEAPGNMGLLDTVLAVKWIKDNVENFGGDQNSITIFGCSAGGALASMFLLSPLTQNLFNRAIIESGNPISYRFESNLGALVRASTFSRQFGCYRWNETAIAKCLQREEASVLVEGQIKEGVIDLTYFMAPVIDGYFLTQRASDVLQTAGAFKRCSILTGVTKDEGTMYIAARWPERYSITQQPTVPLSDTELHDKLSEFFAEFLVDSYVNSVLADVNRVYQIDKLKQEVPDPGLTLLNYVIGDVINTCPQRRIANTYANASQNVYFYSFNHRRERSKLSAWVGAMHATEMPFVFGTATDTTAYSDRESRLSRSMMTYWANFAKFGNPSPDGSDNPKWPTYSPPDSGNIILFTESADVQLGQTEDKRCSYWNTLPAYYLRN